MFKKTIILTFALFVGLLFAGSMAMADDVVSLNTGTVEDLMNLPMADIPEELAEAIVKYREANGPFKTPEELSKVPGMTQDYLEEINPQLTEDGDIVHDPNAEPALAPSKC
jgi:competence protein ComEA